MGKEEERRRLKSNSKLLTNHVVGNNPFGCCYRRGPLDSPHDKRAGGKSSLQHDGTMWNYFQRDRDNSYPTWFTKRQGQGVSEGCPYHSYGLEKVPDDYKRKSAQ